MSVTDQLRRQIIDWSNKFPLDSTYRRKHNIIFNSPQHRELNQIDIYFDWLESKIHEEFLEEARRDIENEKLFARGTWIRDSFDDDSADHAALFEKLNTSDFNSQLAIES